MLDASGQLITGESVDFEVTDPDVVSLYPIMTTGSTRSMRAGVTGKAVGTTRVIATHRSGTADTAVVEVRAGAPGSC